MKKLLLFLFLLFVNIYPAWSKTTLNGEISFDWISKTQMERDENINQIKNEIFSEDVIYKYDKKEFKNEYSDKLKDKNYLTNYVEVSKGKREDSEKFYCGFYWKKLLVAYGVQYKNNLNKNFYYDTMGHLRWVDIYSSEYPKFPYITYQYSTAGKLNAVYYFKSSYDQYIYNDNGEFRGRWYKDKMYDRHAKVIMTRSNWE